MLVIPGRSLHGTVRLPGDKSISHRAALFAALAQGDSHLENFLVAGVTHVMLDALRDLGVSWELIGNRLTVQGTGRLQTPAGVVQCGNSGTTMRLLAGAIAGARVPAVLDGSPGLRRRPMDRIIEPLRRMGVEIRGEQDQFAPLSIWPSRSQQIAAGEPGSGGEDQIEEDPVGPGKDRLDSSNARTLELPVASAQVKTCLLLAALAAAGPTTIIEPGPSRDHSERLLRSMGIAVQSEQVPAAGLPAMAGSGAGQRPDSPSGPEYRTTIQPPAATARTYKPLRMTIPGDISSAAFLIVAALITPGSEITVTEVGMNPTRTGLLDALRAMGARVLVSNLQQRGHEPVADLTVRHSTLRGTQVSGPLVVRMIDEFPVFAVAACFARGPTIVSQAEELRHKESDRITALCQQLGAVGVDIEERADGFRLPGSSQPQGGLVDPQGDHRLAMALAVAGLAAKEAITIQNANIIQESFPGFRSSLEHLGAAID